MHTNFNLSHLNESNIDIWVAPVNDWHLYTENFSLGILNFTWNVTTFNNSLLVIQLYFDYPAEISPTKIYD